MCNPVLAGRFQTLLLALLHRFPTLLEQPAFRGLLVRVVRHIEIAGWQECLALLASDLPDTFGGALSRESPAVPYRWLAECALQFARRPDPARLHGLFCALAHVASEQQHSGMAAIACDPDVFLRLAGALGAIALDRDSRLALCEGVRFLKALMKSAIGPEAAQVRRMRRQWARALFVKLGVDREEQWESAAAGGPLTPAQSAAVDLFPAAWPGGIEFMWPLLFVNPIVSAKVGRAILAVLLRWKREKPPRFEVFLREHRILERIRAAQWVSPVDEGVRKAETGVLALNPFVFRLAALISSGKFEAAPMADDADPDAAQEGERPPPIFADLVPEYDRHTEWVRTQLMPYLEAMQGRWNEVGPKLKRK